MNAPAPRRWLEQEGELPDLLRQAQQQYETGLDGNRALARIEQRKRPRPVARFIVPALALGVALALPWLSSLRALLEPPPLQLTAEQLPPMARPAEPAATPAPATPGSVRAPSSSVEPGVKHTAPGTSGIEKREGEPAAKLASPAAVEPGALVAPGSAEVQEDCLGHARAGDPRRAATCFAGRAQGTGLSAQVALYELSRLQRDSLDEPAQALATLEQSLSRFPDGSLSGEARFSRLELLAKLGRAADALSASSEFLSSRFGSERAAEVHLLRGNLLQRSLGQPQQAADEYRAALAAPGRVGDEAAFQLGLALESAGDRGSARLAYQQYLVRSGGRHAAAARARLEALGP